MQYRTFKAQKNQFPTSIVPTLHAMHPKQRIYIYIYIYIYMYLPPHWLACLRINAQCVPYITNYNAPEWNQHLNMQNHFGSTSEISCWSINEISEVDSTVCIQKEFANKPHCLSNHKPNSTKLIWKHHKNTIAISTTHSNETNIWKYKIALNQLP